MSLVQTPIVASRVGFDVSLPLTGGREKPWSLLDLPPRRLGLIAGPDARSPEGHEIVGLDPGELFVHRNVANLAPPQDANYLSVLQFAVDVLKVQHILVVGHYGCGGVAAAVDGKRRGLVDHWLHPIREVERDHRAELSAIADPHARLDRLTELNVVRQVRNVASDVFVQDAWARGQPLCVHGWVYTLTSGLVTDLEVTVDGPEAMAR
jgi:carbonic anhydrase